MDENRKWFLLSVVSIGILMTWMFGALLTWVGAMLNWHARPVMGVFPFYYAASAVLNSFLVFYVIRKKSIELFANETVLEVKKVSWPTTSETAKSTGIVLVAVFICAAILWMYDSILTYVLKFVLG